MSSAGRRGSVKQAANGTWYFVLDVPSSELGADGKPKRKQTRRRGFKTRKAAVAELNKVLSELDGEAYVAPSDQMLRDFLREWLAATVHTRRPSTQESYERAIRLHVENRPIGLRKLQQVDGPSLNRHYTLLLAGNDDHEALSPTTVHGIAMILQKAFKDAIRWQRIGRNPVELSDPPQPSETEMKTWTAGQLDTFLETAREHRHSALWWILGTTGMRRGEALGLKWADVDMEKGEIRIQRTLLTGNGGKRWGTPKTKAGRRTVSIPADTVAVLKTHRARQNAEKLALGAGYVDQDLITAQEDGDTVSPTRITEQFGRLARRAGLPHIRLHDLRHSWATQALEAGVNPKIAQTNLGHTKVSTTLDIYSHVNQGVHAETAELLASMRRSAAAKKQQS